MLWTIFVILLVLWLLGLVSSYTFGGFIHILLVLAILTDISRVVLFWLAFILTRPFGATIGDVLTKPTDRGGLGLGSGGSRGLGSRGGRRRRRGTERIRRRPRRQRPEPVDRLAHGVDDAAADGRARASSRHA